MRNFDLSPLYRSAIGFDRLFNLIESGQNQGGRFRRIRAGHHGSRQHAGG